MGNLYDLKFVGASLKRIRILVQAAFTLAEGAKEGDSTR
jgi:hypothetical protein